MQVIIPAGVTLKALQSTDISVAYRPLLVGTLCTFVSFHCGELGEYKYKLNLKGTQAPTEKHLVFNVPLGSEEAQVFRFVHWSNEKCDYRCYFEHTGTNASPESPFSCQPVAKAEATKESEIELLVTFEPQLLGETARDVLIISSPACGEYQCSVMGSCVPPRPQGPIDISKGSSCVSFKNVFSADAEFLYTIDNPCFSVKTSEKIGPKKTVSIPITYKSDGSGTHNGRLTISCPSRSNAQWLFYLKA